MSSWPFLDIIGLFHFQNIQKNKYSTQLEVSGRLSAVERGRPRAETGGCRHSSRLGARGNEQEVRKGAKGLRAESAGKCLMCKREDLSLNLSTHIKKRNKQKPKCDRTSVIQAERDGEEWFPGLVTADGC